MEEEEIVSINTVPFAQFLDCTERLKKELPFLPSPISFQTKKLYDINAPLLFAGAACSADTFWYIPEKHPYRNSEAAKASSSAYWRISPSSLSVQWDKRSTGSSRIPKQIVQRNYSEQPSRRHHSTSFWVARQEGRPILETNWSRRGHLSRLDFSRWRHLGYPPPSSVGFKNESSACSSYLRYRSPQLPHFSSPWSASRDYNKSDPLQRVCILQTEELKRIIHAGLRCQPIHQTSGLGFHPLSRSIPVGGR